MASEEEPSTSTSLTGEGAPAKLFLGGLSWDTTEEKLRDHFGRYGDIIEAVVMRDRQTGRPRGFGFVTFVEHAVADRVVEDIHVIDGRQIDAKKSVPQEQKPKARKIFVGGLGPETTEDQFQEYFGQFGEVVEAQIMQDHMSGRSRGFGFVTFEEDSSAEAVFAAGPMHEVGGKRVEVKPATPKGSGPTGGRASGAGAAGGGRAARGGEPSPGFPGRGGGGPGAGGMAFGPGGFQFGVPPYGYVGAPGMVAAPGAYGMQGYPNPFMQQMMMQQMQQMGGYPGQAGFGYPAPGVGGPGRGAPGPQQLQPGGRQGPGGRQPQQQYLQPYQTSAAQPFPRPRSSTGRATKVDSASSLDQHSSEQFKKLSLE